MHPRDVAALARLGWSLLLGQAALLVTAVTALAIGILLGDGYEVVSGFAVFELARERAGLAGYAICFGLALAVCVVLGGEVGNWEASRTLGIQQGDNARDAVWRRFGDTAAGLALVLLQAGQTGATVLLTDSRLDAGVWRDRAIAAVVGVAAIYAAMLLVQAWRSKGSFRDALRRPASARIALGALAGAASCVIAAAY